MSKPDGGAAFPSQLHLSEKGMTLRDYFAAKAMHAIVSNSQWTKAIGKVTSDDDHQRGIMADMAYAFADAMLAQRVRE